MWFYPVIGSVLIVSCLMGYVPAYAVASPSSQDAVLTQRIDVILKEVESLKVGMTRKDVLKLFEEEGGISNRNFHRYVYKTCPYIKVDFEFRSVGTPDDSLHDYPVDVITKMSKPYLERSIND